MKNTGTIDLAVVINSYNRLPLLIKALASIHEVLVKTYPRSAIIIMDAGSDDGSIEFIRAFISKEKELEIRLLQQKGLSFSEGCNFAVQSAAASFPGLKWIFLYETDNFIRNEHAIPKAVRFLVEKEDFAAVGFTVEKHDASKAGFGIRYPTVLSFILGQQLSSLLKLEIYEIRKWNDFEDTKWAEGEVVFTSPLLIRQQAWKKIGGMDHVHFPFSECDIDLCKRWHDQKMKVGVMAVRGIIHDNLLTKSEWSSRRTLNYHQARFMYLKKYMKGTQLIKPLLFLRHLAEFMVLLFRAEKKSLQTRKLLMQRVWKAYR